MTDFPIDPNAPSLGFVVNPANGHGMATGGNTPQPQLVQVGWYCWRCEGLVEQPCRSDSVPVSVPAEWAGDMEAEIRRLGEEPDADPGDLTGAYTPDPPIGCLTVRTAPDPADGPTVAECAADDKTWDLRKAGE